MRRDTNDAATAILPTTVIGSYSMPEWLERAKNDYLSRRLSRRDLDEMHDAVRKAAIKDQEAAGIDIVSDGEAQRDNMIDYFTERMPGVQVDHGRSASTTTSTTASCARSWPPARSACAEEARFLGRFTDHESKISISGPHTLVKRIQNKFYPTRRGVRARSRPGAEPRAEGTGAGRGDRDPDRRAVLLGLPRGSAVGASRRSTRWSTA